MPGSGTATTLSFSNQKGGVGKTTSVLNTGYALSSAGFRVLLVDLDPQASLTISCGIRPEQIQASVYNLLLETGKKPEAKEVTRSVPSLACDLLPATIDLAKAELDLISEFNREHSLEHALTPLLAAYDFILIDCPPSLGLLTINALAASSRVVIPIQSDYLALRGASLLLETIEKVQRRLNPHLQVLAVLITMHDKRTIHAREVSEEIRSRFGTLVLDEPVPYSVRVKDAAIASESILTFDPNSAMAQAYKALARRIQDGKR